PELGVAYLSKLMETDLSVYPLDGPVPPPDPQKVGGTATRESLAKVAREGNMTIRQAYKHVLPQASGNTLRGDVKTVVDQMEDWFVGKACDGFMLGFPVVPYSLKTVVDLIVPELQRRGLFRKEYSGATLRENMGLSRPANRFFPVGS